MANIAVDFDGTIVTHEFPHIGVMLPGAKETIKALQANGHKVFLWTMRGYHPEHKQCLEEAVQFLEENGCELDGINRSTSGFSTTSPKQHANLYIDDSALGCPLCYYFCSDWQQVLAADWYEISKALRELGYITSEQYSKICDDIHNTYSLKEIPYRPY